MMEAIMNRKEKTIKTILLGLGIMAVMFFYYQLNTVGYVSTVSRRAIETELFDVQDIEAAMGIVEATFKKEFTGSQLIDLWYEETFSSTYSSEWAKQYEADEAIILLSTFHTGDTWVSESLEPDTTYPNWQWVLVRNHADNNWQLKTWGY